MAFDDWLNEATPSDLESLAQALLDGRIPAAESAASIQRAGFDEGAIGLLNGMRGTDSATAGWFLKRLADERRRADDRYAAMARLVWSGPLDDDEALRDTGAVLDDLFARARHHVLLATYAMWDGRSIFGKLAETMRANTSLTVDFYVHLKEAIGSEERHARAFVENFSRKHWPEGVRLPNLYYDPRTLKGGVSLHAKCVVVDGERAFVTSANFTEAAQERNIEVGVLLDHPHMAKALVERFGGLRDAGILKAMTAGGSSA
ncbi:MAG: DISARM system phospholipase D-like protein DrmC [Polyangiaceae bacterium]